MELDVFCEFEKLQELHLLGRQASRHGRQMHQHASVLHDTRRPQADTCPELHRRLSELRRGLSEDSEDYQANKRTHHTSLARLRGKRDPALADVPQRYPRPSRSSKKTRSPTLPIPNEGGLDYYTNDGS